MDLGGPIRGWDDTLSQVYQSARQTERPGRSRSLKYSPNKEVRSCMADVLLTSKGYRLHAPLSPVYFFSCRANNASPYVYEVKGVIFDRIHLGDVCLGPVTQLHRHDRSSSFASITCWVCCAGISQCDSNTWIGSYHVGPPQNLERRS